MERLDLFHGKYSCPHPNIGECKDHCNSVDLILWTEKRRKELETYWAKLLFHWMIGSISPKKTKR